MCVTKYQKFLSRLIGIPWVTFYFKYKYFIYLLSKDGKMFIHLCKHNFLKNWITAWKGSKFGLFSSPYFAVFDLNTIKYGPEKTIFVHWILWTPIITLSSWKHIYNIFNPFLADVPISYSLKTPENIEFFGIFSGSKTWTLVRNGLNSVNIKSSRYQDWWTLKR